MNSPLFSRGLDRRAFIVASTMGVAGMATGASGSKFRDRSFRAMLDILDYGDFNHTYFPSTVGFLTLLMMSGNFPTP